MVESLRSAEYAGLPYFCGGLLVIEKIFNYNGIGLRIFTAAQNKDVVMLESSVLVVGIVYLVATLLADVFYTLVNPRLRHAASQWGGCSPRFRAPRRGWFQSTGLRR